MQRDEKWLSSHVPGHVTVLALSALLVGAVSASAQGDVVGNTRNSRIDYIWHSESASRLRLRQVRVFDVRNSSGVMPSDHRPLMATYDVR